jgi:hypothetical protein
MVDQGTYAYGLVATFSGRSHTRRVERRRHIAFLATASAVCIAERAADLLLANAGHQGLFGIPNAVRNIERSICSARPGFPAGSPGLSTGA